MPDVLGRPGLVSDASSPMTYVAAMHAAELTHGWVRLARAGVLGGASLFLATAGHVVGGGRLPGPGLLAVIGVALAVVAVSLTARRLRFGLLLGVLTVEQLGLHLMLHAATATSACTGVVMPGHAMEATTVCGAGAGAAAVGSTSGWPMLLGHAVALLATAWLLAVGEQWLWRVVDEIHRCASTRPRRVRRPRSAVVALVRTVRAQGARLCAGPRAPPAAQI